MYKILKKETLNSLVKLMVIEAPLVAKKAEPGQFVILRLNDVGERFPLTIADFDREKGTITIVFQEMGKSTKQLGSIKEGDSILDFVGPLGNPSHLEGKKILAIAGGVGVAPLYPQVKKLHQMGIEVDVIIGARTEELVIWEDKMREVASRVFIMTDDGSKGEKGLVTDKAKELIEGGNNYDSCIAIGPLIMMKFVCLTTKGYNLKTIVSMNPIMIDGTGMCGGCRVKVGDQIKFACVDGPEFDGHLVDFDKALRRQGMYKDLEKQADEHACKIGLGK